MDFIVVRERLLQEHVSVGPSVGMHSCRIGSTTDLNSIGQKQVNKVKKTDM